MGRTLRKVGGFASLALALACSPGAVEPGGTAPLPPRGGKFDLPNEGLYQREYNGVGYGPIVERFADHGFDVRSVDMELFEARWPLDDAETAVLARQGTPVQVRSRVPLTYCHTAFDVHRSDPDGSDAVLAPVGGMAMITDWNGNPAPNGNPDAVLGRENYITVVSIWDPRSHAVVQLMHVAPADTILGHDEPFEVERGQVLGTFAPTPSVVSDDPAVLERFRHTHVNIVNGEERIIHNPARWLPYRDEKKPVFVRAYVLGAGGVIQAGYGGGTNDLVVEVYDSDDALRRNFEVGALAYEIRDGDGALLFELDRCNLDDLFRHYETTDHDGVLNLIDFGNAQHQIEMSDWRGNDIGYGGRTFRYALTQLAHDEEDRCMVLDDRDGELSVPPEVDRIEVHVTAWDHNGNSASFTAALPRIAPDPLAADAGAPTIDADGGTGS